MGAESGKLRRLPVDLSEIEEIAGESDEPMYQEHSRSGWVDTQTGEVHIIYQDTFCCANGELEVEALEEWQVNDLEAAEAILRDTEGRYRQVERWDSSEEFRLMEEFATATATPRLRAALLDALRGRKPFRRFKDTLLGWPEARQAWFSYQTRAHRERIAAWLRTLGIDSIDTSSYQPPPVPDRW
jgi:hypothetical protein